MAKGVQADRDTHRVRGPDRGAQQDEPGHRPGSGLDGAAAPDNGAVRPHLAGLPVYKMTGSGNDFVMVDGRISSRETGACPTSVPCAPGAPGSALTGWCSSLRDPHRVSSVWPTSTRTVPARPCA